MKHTGLRRLVQLGSILLRAGWLIAGAAVFQAHAQPGGVEVRPGPRVQTPPSCCVVTAVDVHNGVVTARETATGSIFQFKVDDPRLTRSLKISQSVGADFQAQLAWIPPMSNRYRFVTAQAPVPGTLGGVAAFPVSPAPAQIQRSPAQDLRPPTLELTCNPTTARGGQSLTCTVRVVPSRPGLKALQLHSSSAIVTMPPVVPIDREGRGSFTAVAGSVSKATQVTLSAASPGMTKTASVTVLPPAIKSISTFSTFAEAGTAFGGLLVWLVVDLTAPAPPAGLSINFEH